jgi:diaminohydroxyphosphoribosylaminopyrimidine deaminase/5-amino-6-(5-phosphoribosylamino)uracil reductase
MRRAIELSRRCTPSPRAYSVGAVVVDPDGCELASGYSRQHGDPSLHAEEAALRAIGPAATGLAGATLYSTLEPCSRRASRTHPCARMIVDAGLRRVVIAWREPDLFVADCVGVEMLRERGVDVVELAELADEARAVNAHLPLG